MSRTLTQQDLITEYGGQLHLPWVPLHLPGIDSKTGREFNGKRPIGAALRETHGHYEPYRSENPSVEQQLLWYADFSANMGGPGFNPGIITGHNSVDPDNALYVVDIDWTDKPPDCLMDCHTTTVRTGNGYHFWFLGPAGAYSTSNRLLLPDGAVCEFKGVEALIVAPPGLHHSGRPYEFLPGLGTDHLGRLPAFVIEGLPMKTTPPQRDTLLLGKPLPFASKGRLCLNQIWGRELQAPGPKGKGEREVALYILWQRGCTLKNDPALVARALYWKNETLKPPLTQAEVQNIINEGLEQDKAGNRHGPVGCRFTRDKLPWVRCEDCPYGGAKVSASLGVALRQGLTAAEWYLLSYTVQKGYKSDAAAADACKMNRRTVKNAREHLQALKLWPDTEDTRPE
jgi:DNA-binding CsgD family transcriptional regulator